MDKLPVRIAQMHHTKEKYDIWEGYLIAGEREKVLCKGTLKQIRQYAKIHGFKGILL